MSSNLVIPALSPHPLAAEFPTRYALNNHASMSMPLYSVYESDSLTSLAANPSEGETPPCCTST